MDRIIFLAARAVIAFVQALPLTVAARLGRALGQIAYWVDPRHRHVALRNLALCFEKEKSPREIKAIGRENFRRLGENFACMIKTASMSLDELRPHFEVTNAHLVTTSLKDASRRNAILAIGHFGNFELYARLGSFVPGSQLATTYRGLEQPALNRLLQSLRERPDIRFFERRSEAAELRAALNEGRLVLGLLADQNAGRGGVRIPFLNRECSTSTAPAVLALRYHCPLFTSVCYRIGLARWRVEVNPQIATHENGEPRSAEAIMLDVNRAFEAAVRRDPANWFWVHKRWKAPQVSPRRRAGRAGLEPREETE